MEDDHPIWARCAQANVLLHSPQFVLQSFCSWSNLSHMTWSESESARTWRQMSALVIKAGISSTTTPPAGWAQFKKKQLNALINRIISVSGSICFSAYVLYHWELNSVCCYDMNITMMWSKTVACSEIVKQTPHWSVLFFFQYSLHALLCDRLFQGYKVATRI